jgi:hypothetical protein
MACFFKLFGGNPKVISLMLTNIAPIHIHINLGLIFSLLILSHSSVHWLCMQITVQF